MTFTYNSRISLKNTSFRLVSGKFFTSLACKTRQSTHLELCKHCSKLHTRVSIIVIETEFMLTVVASLLSHWNGFTVPASSSLVSRQGCNCGHSSVAFGTLPEQWIPFDLSQPLQSTNTAPYITLWANNFDACMEQPCIGIRK
jgi:hypothetical protein